jgi:hypothetical protein
MRLQSLKYDEYESGAQYWALDGLELGSRNLLVGKNATGKSRTLNVIDSLSLFLSGKHPPGVSGHYYAKFYDGDKSLLYELNSFDNKVLRERFISEGTVLLDRGVGGVGKIFAEKIGGGSDVDFQTPPEQLAAVARRDQIQHSFLEPLHAWATSVRHYNFGTSMGKEQLAMFRDQGPPPNELDGGQTVGLFYLGNKEFGEAFRNAIARDMETIGYPIDEVGLAPLISARTPAGVVGLFAKEKNLTVVTDQVSMSQGMFRALALFIHINFCLFKHSATCLLIDDIGEGLDFERSWRLIDTVRAKTDEGRIQLVLATNDRFVMNQVPLDEWSVLMRTGSTVHVRNARNSKEAFEEFKFTGLSNFSFLEMDVLGGASGHA